jgi:hypothetical protein
MYKHLLACTFLLGFLGLYANGQTQILHHCANPDVYRNHPEFAGGKMFETWLSQIKNAESEKAVQDNDQLYYIPVVVHILHNGEAVGTDRNLSDARIQSQIDILNNDYGRVTGTPGFNTDPRGADTRIRFCLATEDPSGQPTNGIVRVNANRDGFAFLSENTLLKNLSLWDPNKYLNIWVCKLLGNQYIGYAQYPFISTTLADSLPMIQPIPDVQPDGVVIDYRVFGDVPPGESGPFPSYNKGRTATHEVGHYLGLIHIWGDGFSCADQATDFVEDTPPQGSFTSGCPLISVQSCMPGTLAMFQNYMDYTNDVCMNIFTKDQKSRMRLVLRNCLRRKTLLQSPTSCGIADSNPVVLPDFLNFELRNNWKAGSLEAQIPDKEIFSRIKLTSFSGQQWIPPYEVDGTVIKIGLGGLAAGIYSVQIETTSGKLFQRRFVR